MKSLGLPAVFLDKDGTLIDDVPYNVDPLQIRLTVGAGEAIQTLCAASYKLIVVSNQSGVARGLFPLIALEAVRARVEELVVDAGGRLDGFYFCPHLPNGSVPEYSIACDCRKPASGMIEQASRELGIDLSRSWVVGDKLDDVEAGRRAGCRTIWLQPAKAKPCDQVEHTDTPTAADLAAAAKMILSAQQFPCERHSGSPDD